MGKTFSFTLTGNKKLLKNLDKLSESIQTKVASEIEGYSQRVNKEQIKLITSLTNTVSGELRRKNVNIPDPDDKTGLTWLLENKMEYAPFVEFGTGGLVKVPQGLEDYAMQFKGKGIKEVNLPARPFFFAPAFNEYKNLIKNIKKALKK